MVRKVTICLFFLSIGFTAVGQNAHVPQVEKHQTVYQIPLGIAHEFGFGKKHTIQLSGPLSIGFTYHSTSSYGYGSERQVTGETFYWTIRPVVSGMYRYYYNLGRRRHRLPVWEHQPSDSGT